MKILILILRSAAYLLVLFIAFRPTIYRPDPSLSSSWALLLDTSKSMAVHDPGARSEMALKITKELIGKIGHPDLFAFAENFKPIVEKDLKTLAFDGRQSNLAQALRNVGRLKTYAGIIVLTDGRQVGPGDPVSEAVSLSRPLVLIGCGDQKYFRDIAVKEVQIPPFAFKNVATSVSAVITAQGFKGREVVVKLKDGENLIGIQNLQPNADEQESMVNFNWIPESLGTKILKLEVNRYSDEFTHQNNMKEISVEVGRDRFRVLYICGQPGPEYGFLRYQFKSDPSVELVTFVILRDSNNILTVPDQELSLIPFPTPEVLINQMATFDLVVFEEFSYQRYGLLPTVLQAIRKKVENGGAFLLTGGPSVFGSEGAYDVPGAEEMLPVTVGKEAVLMSQGPHELIIKVPNHPIFHLTENPQKNMDLWRNMPPLEDVALLPTVKPGAQVLATIKARGKEFPVLVAWSHGKGRVGVLSARTTFRFSMGGENNTEGTLVYQQFWKNIVLWLTHGDQFKNVRVSFEPKPAQIGEEGMARIWVNDEYFRPISDVEVRVKVRTPGGESIQMQPHLETEGVFVAPLKIEAGGSYDLSVWVFRKGKRMGTDEVRFYATDHYIEEEDLRVDYGLLARLAEATGGQFIYARDFTLDAFNEFREEIGRRVGTKYLLWNSLWFLGSLIVLFGVEWFIRKRQGWP